MNTQEFTDIDHYVDISDCLNFIDSGIVEQQGTRLLSRLIKERNNKYVKKLIDNGQNLYIDCNPLFDAMSFASYEMIDYICSKYKINPVKPIKFTRLVHGERKDLEISPFDFALSKYHGKRMINACLSLLKHSPENIQLSEEQLKNLIGYTTKPNDKILGQYTFYHPYADIKNEKEYVHLPETHYNEDKDIKYTEVNISDYVEIMKYLFEHNMIPKEAESVIYRYCTHHTELYKWLLDNGYADPKSSYSSVALMRAAYTKDFENVKYFIDLGITTNGNNTDVYENASEEELEKLIKLGFNFSTNSIRASSPCIKNSELNSFKKLALVYENDQSPVDRNTIWSLIEDILENNYIYGRSHPNEEERKILSYFKQKFGITDEKADLKFKDWYGVHDEYRYCYMRSTFTEYSYADIKKEASACCFLKSGARPCIIDYNKNEFYRERKKLYDKILRIERKKEMIDNSSDSKTDSVEEESIFFK